MYLNYLDFKKCSFLGQNMIPYFDSEIVEINLIRETIKANKDIIKEIVDVNSLFEDRDGFTEVNCSPIHTDKGLVTSLEINHEYKNYRYISCNDNKYYFEHEITLVNMIKFN